MDSLILSIRNLNKHFGGVTAVRDMSLDIMEGEIVGLMGPNGAGKTTLLNLIYGEFKPDSGEILFRERNITGMAPYKICRLGVGRTYQIPLPYSNMTVTQNLIAPAMYGRNLNRAKAEKQAAELLEFTGLSYAKNVLAQEL